MKAKILIINGSANGRNGQSQLLSETICASYQDIEFHTLLLKEQTHLELWNQELTWADGFIFLSGTYWDSWGSPLQYFLEQTTHFEVSKRWLGKPAGVIITMHSVGGKAILSRLQGVLNSMGAIIPPMTGMVYSLATHLANKVQHTHAQDFWQLGEIDLIVKNLKQQISINHKIKQEWSTWEIDERDVTRPWLTKSEISLKG